MAKSAWNPFEEWVDAVLRTILLGQRCQVDKAPGKAAQFVVTPPDEAPFAVSFEWEDPPARSTSQSILVFGHPMPTVRVWLAENPDRVAFETPLAARVMESWLATVQRIQPRIVPVVSQEGSSP
jgi:hypothetical protein